MRVLELFSGTESISKAFRERGHQTFTIDNDGKHFQPDLCTDIMELTTDDIINNFDVPHIIWASPPCQCFSVASIPHYWIKPLVPKTQATLQSIKLVLHTIKLIQELQPVYWFIENPVGLLKKQGYMRRFPIRTITYCQYGDFRQKPTNIWGKFPLSMLWLKCDVRSICHEPVGRKNRNNGTFSLKTSIERAMVPDLFCKLLALACEHDFRDTWSLSANDVRDEVDSIYKRQMTSRPEGSGFG